MVNILLFGVDEAIFLNVMATDSFVTKQCINMVVARACDYYK